MANDLKMLLFFFGGFLGYAANVWGSITSSIICLELQ